MLLDSCVGRAECQSSADAPPAPGVLARLLNVDAPLQLGGSSVPLSVLRQVMAWLQVPQSDGFFGCLENVTFMGTVSGAEHSRFQPPLCGSARPASLV